MAAPAHCRCPSQRPLAGAQAAHSTAPSLPAAGTLLCHRRHLRHACHAHARHAPLVPRAASQRTHSVQLSPLPPAMAAQTPLLRLGSLVPHPPHSRPRWARSTTDARPAGSGLSQAEHAPGRPVQPKQQRAPRCNRTPSASSPPRRQPSCLRMSSQLVGRNTRAAPQGCCRPGACTSCVCCSASFGTLRPRPRPRPHPHLPALRPYQTPFRCQPARPPGSTRRVGRRGAPLDTTVWCWRAWGLAYVDLGSKFHAAG